MESIVRTKELTKTYGEKTVVNHVSMCIKKGDIYGFIGRNGAGKTTTMKLLLGTIFPTSGEIEMFGSRDLNPARARTGSLIEAPGLYRNCTAYENMKRFSMISGGNDKEIKELLSYVGLGKVGSKKAGSFSLGMRQRLGIAIAMLGNPELLILDEPINGLDPAGIKEIRDLILKINQERGVTVLVSSHLLDELSKITTRYGIINSGTLVEEVSAAELAERCKQYLKISVHDSAAAKKLILSRYPEMPCEEKEGALQIASESIDSAELNRLLVSNGIAVSEIAFARGNFEDYFIERIGN